MDRFYRFRSRSISAAQAPREGQEENGRSGVRPRLRTLWQRMGSGRIVPTRPASVKPRLLSGTLSTTRSFAFSNVGSENNQPAERRLVQSLHCEYCRPTSYVLVPVTCRSWDYGKESASSVCFFAPPGDIHYSSSLPARKPGLTRFPAVRGSTFLYINVDDVMFQHNRLQDCLLF